MTQQTVGHSAGSVPDLEFRIEMEREIAAPIQTVFESLLVQLGPEACTPDGTKLNMTLEPYPGGRWYRDLGDDQGHLWGHVQSIKKHTLLEITGPLFMSRACANNVIYRLAEADGKTTLRMVHSGLGVVTSDHLAAMEEGWKDQIDRVEKRCG